MVLGKKQIYVWHMRMSNFGTEYVFLKLLVPYIWIPTRNNNQDA